MNQLGSITHYEPVCTEHRCFKLLLILNSLNVVLKIIFCILSAFCISKYRLRQTIFQYHLSSISLLCWVAEGLEGRGVNLVCYAWYQICFKFSSPTFISYRCTKFSSSCMQGLLSFFFPASCLELVLLQVKVLVTAMAIAAILTWPMKITSLV